MESLRMVVNPVILQRQGVRDVLRSTRQHNTYDILQHQHVEVLANEGVLVVLDMPVLLDQRMVDALLNNCSRGAIPREQCAPGRRARTSRDTA